MSKDFEILIVEDEQVIIKSAIKILSEEGISIDSVLNVEDALVKINEKKYNLILTDLMLPKISGMELVQIIKEKFSQIPIIMITGYATNEKAIESIKTGAFDFIPKPFSVEELLGVVNRCIKYIKACESKDHLNTIQENLKKQKNQGQFHYFGQHSWIKIDNDKTAIIGVGESFFHTLGDIDVIEFPNINEEIIQGNVALKIRTIEQHMHTMWAPMSGVVIEINPLLAKDFSLLDKKSFSDGWTLKIKPTQMETEVENLFIK